MLDASRIELGQQAVDQHRGRRRGDASRVCLASGNREFLAGRHRDAEAAVCVGSSVSRAFSEERLPANSDTASQSV